MEIDWVNILNFVKNKTELTKWDVFIVHRKVSVFLASLIFNDKSFKWMVWRTEFGNTILSGQKSQNLAVKFGFRMNLYCLYIIDEV